MRWGGTQTFRTLMLTRLVKKIVNFLVSMVREWYIDGTLMVC
jgi:hypothetical protein